MTPRLIAALLAGAGLTIGNALWAQAPQRDEFQHLPHQRMFPKCEGCHELQPTEMTFPQPALCAACHNGQMARQVHWNGPERPPSNLKFTHTRHNEALGVALPCQTCHNRPGAERMDVRLPEAAQCLGCHAAGKNHKVDAPCDKCHVPLGDAGDFTVDRIRAIEPPADHTQAFLQTHGDQARESTARCAVCHARDLCSSCHANAATVAAIQALPPDPRVAAIVADRRPAYPTPATHAARDWWESHGGRISPDASDCAVCHTQRSCRACHIDPVPKPVRNLRPEDAVAQPPRAPREQGPGVSVARRPPPTHTLTFQTTHRTQGAGGTVQCATCHTRNECASCHTGSEALARPGERVARYHVPNFQEQHSAAAFGREVECASCHNPQVFCRDCHRDVGLGTVGRFDTGFHAGKPMWVFGHGQGARQGLESCATCHAQRDCLACHSAVGGRRVKPHGPGFDASRLRSKNPGMCLACHWPSILGG